MKVHHWAHPCITCSNKLFLKAMCQFWTNVCLCLLLDLKPSETRKWGMGKEGKILFQFILVLFPVCLVILQLGKDRAVGPVFVPTFMLSTLCCFTLAALLKRSVCCHFPLLFTMCTTTGLNWDQIPLYWALFEHLQTAIQDWKNLKSLPT